MRTQTRMLLGGIALLTIAGCGEASGAGNAVPSSSAPATAPSAAPGATVMTAAVNGHGTVLVAASNRMTLYQFSMDIAGSGTSACTSACITRWPALTVPAGSSASAAGITGQFGTIIRADGGGTQVTYNGRPLHFFSGDSQAGDANGNYPNWSVVAVTAAAAAGSSGGGGATAPTATPTSGY